MTDLIPSHPSGDRCPQTRVNKHGVPVYSFTAPRDRCAWPSCGAVVTTYPETHLCDRHAIKVHERISADLAAAEAERRAHEQRDRDRLKARAERNFPPAVPVTPQRQPASDPVIYYVRNDGYIKIGWTSDLTKRMRAYPPGCTLLAVHPGTRADERALHRKFSHLRSHGREWYPLAPQITEHIRLVVDEHGEPDSVDFGAKPVEVPRPHQQHGAPRVKGFVTGNRSRILRG